MKKIITILITLITFNFLTINNYSYCQNYYMRDYIMNLEEEFTKNNYTGSGQVDFKYEKGSIPILISAPHTVKQWRHNKYKSQEVYTGALIKLLGQKTNAHIIYKTHTKGDENYTTKETAYRKKIKEIVKENNIKVVLDLHGMSENRKSDIDIGTGGINHRNLLKNEDILYCIEDNLKDFNYTVNKYFTGGNSVTMSSYCSQKLGVPTLQLEINRQLRQLNNDNFIHLVNELSKMILNLDEHWAFSQVLFLTVIKGINKSEIVKESLDNLQNGLIENLK